MPRTAAANPLIASIELLGRQIGQQLATAITSGFQESIGRNGLKVGGKVGRPAASARNVAAGEKACSVPGCVRAKAAKGLCQNHYAKAKRLKMNLESLSNSNLEELGQDGRATRFSGKR